MLCIAGAESTSVKAAVKAALGQKVNSHKSPSSYALLDPSAEARAQFWARPGLQDPTLQESCQHAWAAVLSPTGKASRRPTAIHANGSAFANRVQGLQVHC